MKKSFIGSSDERIEKSLAVLRRTDRGREALKDICILLEGPGVGLDIEGGTAVVTLVLEFFFNHRRGFFFR
jgi:hypothetical protein